MVLEIETGAICSVDYWWSFALANSNSVEDDVLLLTLDQEICRWCDRFVVDRLPKECYAIECGGKGCGHRTVYGLVKEDCRQVVLRDE